MVGARELAAQGLRRCRGCGGIKIVIPDAQLEGLKDQLRALGEDPASLDQCLACEQHAVIRAARDAGSTVSLDDFRRLLDRAGRNAGPWLLLDAWCFGVISQPTITAVTADVWSAAEYPQDALRQVDWLELFTVAGFTIDGRPANRPERPVTLWRGCVPRLRRRMSWTGDRELAQRFASEGFRGRPQGRLYETTAPPEALLCINHASRQESEYVIYSKGLVIREAISEENGASDLDPTA